MAKFLADTHALLRHLAEPRRLGKAARRAFAMADQGRAVCYVPAIAIVEFCLLYERGRLRVSPRQILESLSENTAYAILAFDLEQALEFGALPAIRDPMDRIIAAAARVTGSRLISADESMDGAGVERVWD